MPPKNLVRSEQEFQNLLRRLELALDASQIGVWQHNVLTNEVIWDAQMHRLYDTGGNIVRDASTGWVAKVHPVDQARAALEFDRAVAEKGLYVSSYRIILDSGETRHLRSRAHYYEDENGTPFFIGAEWDVTADVMLTQEVERQRSVAEARAVALQESNARIEYAAEHDYLTALPNRRHFERRLSELRVDASVGTLAIMHIDLDRFKQINDRFGHAAGDAVLQSAAEQITAAVPENGLVARIGGDEFVVVLSNVSCSDALRLIADEIVERLGNGVWHDGELLVTGASIGISWNDDRGSANLLVEADLALYQAKRLGRNRVELFTPDLQASLLGERQLLEDLRHALERDEILPFYQVQVDAVTSRIVGLEALARWYHPTRGLLPPAVFLGVAGENGLTADIDAAILRRALSDRAYWALRGLSVPRISVNISGSRLADPRLPAVLARLDIPPDCIVFELVETIFLDDCDPTTVSNIEAIKRMGIEIEIDDFGSGHASLIGLVRLKPKRLKIDRQLVTDIIASDEQRRLVGSIVEIARALDVGVIAEGVETMQHARILAEFGCEALQGYAFGKPVPAYEIYTRLAAEAEALSAGRKDDARGRAATRRSW